MGKGNSKRSNKNNDIWQITTYDYTVNIIIIFLSLCKAWPDLASIVYKNM